MKSVSWLCAVVVLAAISCKGGEDPALTGQAVYSEPQPDGNSFACATCHALTEPAADGFRRPGHAIGDSLRRPSYKNAQLSSWLDAANVCLGEWMAAEPWSADSEAYVALRGFLEDQDAGKGEAEPLVFEIVAPPAGLEGGDATRGRELFNESCAVCHAANAVGTNRAPPLVGDLLEPAYVAERIRLSGRQSSSVYPNLTGGRMPFWAADRVSDEELLDLLAFVATAVGDQGQGGGPDDTPPTSGSGGPPARSCGSTHPSVGRTAEFITYSHGVMGTVTILDDCTIGVERFHYDGQGIVVEAYSGQNGNFEDGFALSGNLRRNQPYEDETLTLSLPEGKTLDDLDSVSIWCVDVSISFGDASFE